MSGKLFLIPTYLDDSNDKDFIAPVVKDVVKNTAHYIVENARTARRYISDLKLDIDISALHFDILDKRSSPEEMDRIMEPISRGEDIGLISEAGLPCLADPGNLAVAWMQQRGEKVVPLTGASSIQMALIASGFNGQRFTFHGYLPIDKVEREKKLRELEQAVEKTGYSQIFMETPFRNNQLLASMMSNLKHRTLLSIAAGISGEKEMIQTKTVERWKKSLPDIHKIPSIFTLGSFPI
ncbi:MAG: SAM-dependent methyltransferase [Cyclobacteriaceae bacterium]